MSSYEKTYPIVDANVILENPDDWTLIENRPFYNLYEHKTVDLVVAVLK